MLVNSGHLSAGLVLDLTAQFQQYTICALQVLLHGAQADPDLLGNDLLRLAFEAVSAQDIRGSLGHLVQRRFDLLEQVTVDRDALGRGSRVFGQVLPELRAGPGIVAPSLLLPPAPPVEQEVLGHLVGVGARIADRAGLPRGELDEQVLQQVVDFRRIALPCQHESLQLIAHLDKKLPHPAGST